MHAFTPRPPNARHERSLLDVTLDPAQRAAVERPAGGAMLVLGEAGHGKTTVLLHRVAHLYRTAGHRFRAIVIVPSEGLRRLLQPLAIRLGADVEVVTYDAWAVREARRAFGDLPRRIGRDAPSAVSALKRDPALREVIETIAARAPGVIDEDREAPPPNTKAQAHRGDLQHLFGDSALLERVALASKRSVPAHAIAAVLDRTRVQFSARTEEANADIDRRRLATADALAIDEGTPDEDAGSFDAEDCAVMFEIDRLRAKRLGARPMRPHVYDLVAIDEAQELAPIELALIGRSLGKSSTLVVAGDADQQVDPSAAFEGWQSTMRSLRAKSYETVVLDIGYRCPPEIAGFARTLRAGGNAGSAQMPVVQLEDEKALASWIARELGRIDELDPDASSCVIARTAAGARRIAAALEGLIPRRLVLTGDFIGHRGPDVTTVDQVKGLELDYVVVADATASAYPDTAEARRALYVAVTRARHGLVLACVGQPTRLAKGRA